MTAAEKIVSEALFGTDQIETLHAACGPLTSGPAKTAKTLYIRTLDG